MDRGCGGSAKTQGKEHMNSQKKLRGISREDAMKPITDFVEPLPDSKHQYWLCCGCTDIRHNYQCVEVKSKNFEICRYGTAKEHSEWQLSLERSKQDIDHPNPAAKHWHDLYRAKCQDFYDKQAMLGAEIVALEEELEEIKEEIEPLRLLAKMKPKDFVWYGLTEEERNEMIGKIQHDQYTRQRDLIGSTQIITEMYLKEKNHGN